MSLLYTGYKRSLVVEVYKNGVITEDSPYNGQQPFHTVGGQIYDLLTDDQFKILSSEGYLQRLQDFQIYVSTLEAGISFTQDIPATYASRITGLNCTTTTTTTTTSTTSTTTTTTTTTAIPELPYISIENNVDTLSIDSVGINGNPLTVSPVYPILNAEDPRLVHTGENPNALLAITITGTHANARLRVDDLHYAVQYKSYLGPATYTFNNIYFGLDYPVIAVLELDTTTTTTTTTSTTSTTTTSTTSTTSSSTTTTTTTCLLTEYVASTPPYDQRLAESVPWETYSEYGMLLFDSGYDTYGVGTFVWTESAYWKNIPKNLTDGPLNRTGIWASGATYANQTVSFSSVFTIVGATKTYYIGMGCDNRAKLTIDGTTIVDQNIGALQNMIQNTIGGEVVAMRDIRVPFTYWYIYPIVLAAGTHYIEMIGVNGTSESANPASFGAQIYDNTPTQIMAATSDGDLTILFDTADKIGLFIQGGSNGIGYTCPVGYSMTPDSPPQCYRTYPGICPTTTTTTTTSTTSTSTTTTTTTV